MNLVTTDFCGEIYLIGKKDGWYIGAGNTFATLTCDGYIQKTEKLPGDILVLISLQ